MSTVRVFAPSRLCESVRTTSRAQAAAEVVCLFALIEAVMWAVPFASRAVEAYIGLVGLIGVMLAVCHVRDGVAARDLGVRLDNFTAVLRVYALPFGGAIGLLVLVGWAAGTLRLGGKFFGMLVGVPAWALLQQYMLLVFLHRRWRVVLGAGAPSVAASAGVFAVLHLPNPGLSVACAAAGAIWVWQYDRGRNLFANAVTHTLGSAFLANTLPAAVLKSMVVGYNYFLR
jgi:hypothetical protein